MDSNSSSFFFNPSSAMHSVYYQPKEDEGIIDLGLSLRTLQPEASYHSSSQLMSLGLEEYENLMEEWPQANNLRLKNPIKGYRGLLISDEGDDEADGIQSTEKWAYVKVNMDGVIVGRKICILDHGDYLSLAHRLEEMFGRQTETGLGLFQAGSEYCLFYKDKEDNWRTVGDVPWKEFAERVRRLRIARN